MKGGSALEEVAWNQRVDFRREAQLDVLLPEAHMHFVGHLIKQDCLPYTRE